MIVKSEAGERRDFRQTRIKLQTAIAERFLLKVRRKTRDMPVLVLAMGKNGAKLQAADRKSDSQHGRPLLRTQHDNRSTSVRNAAPFLGIRTARQEEQIRREN